MTVSSYLLYVQNSSADTSSAAIFGFSPGSKTAWGTYKQFSQFILQFISSRPPPLLLIVISYIQMQSDTLVCCSLTDWRSPCSDVVSVDQWRGWEPSGPADFPWFGEREHFSGQSRQEAGHLFLTTQDATFGLKGVGHSVREAGHQASQLQVPIALLLQ